MYGIGEVTPEAAAERARQHAEAEAEFERQYGDAVMPGLIAAYEIDLAAWEAEQAAEAVAKQSKKKPRK
jgi:hypothetical protein